MYDLTQMEVIMLTSFMDVTHEKYLIIGLLRAIFVALLSKA